MIKNYHNSKTINSNQKFYQNELTIFFLLFPRNNFFFYSFLLFFFQNFFFYVQIFFKISSKFIYSRFFFMAQPLFQIWLNLRHNWRHYQAEQLPSSRISKFELWDGRKSLKIAPLNKVKSAPDHSIWIAQQK